MGHHRDEGDAPNFLLQEHECGADSVQSRVGKANHPGPETAKTSEGSSQDRLVQHSLLERAERPAMDDVHILMVQEAWIHPHEFEYMSGAVRRQGWDASFGHTARDTQVVTVVRSTLFAFQIASPDSGKF